MKVHQVCELGPGTDVWVWIVRVGKGRWWPGSVLSITAVQPFPMIDTRFECRSAGKKGVDGPAFVGITTTRMRYLELRDPHLKSEDRPNFTPTAIFAQPEESLVSGSATFSICRRELLMTWSGESQHHFQPGNLEQGRSRDRRI